MGRRRHTPEQIITALREAPRSFTVTTSGSPGRFSVLTRRFGGGVRAAF